MFENARPCDQWKKHRKGPYYIQKSPGDNLLLQINGGTDRTGQYRSQIRKIRQRVPIILNCQPGKAAALLEIVDFDSNLVRAEVLRPVFQKADLDDLKPSRLPHAPSLAAIGNEDCQKDRSAKSPC
ncbi:hypothetical protein ES703_124057 [subsurface metagenome]